MPTVKIFIALALENLKTSKKVSLSCYHFVYFFYAFRVLLFPIYGFFFGGQIEGIMIFLNKTKKNYTFQILIINSTSFEFHLAQSSNMILMLLLLAALGYIFKIR